MKKSKKICAFALVCIMVISAFGGYNALAACNYQNALAVDYNCHYLIYGVSGRTYYIDSTASAYTSVINAAVSDWNSMSADVSFSKSTASSPVRFIYGTVSLANSPGQTIVYSVTSEFEPTVSNWNGAKIILSNTMFRDLVGDKKQGTCAHEFGHALGLAHMKNLLGGNEPNWIMTPYENRTAYKVDARAVDVVDNHLY